MSKHLKDPKNTLDPRGLNANELLRNCKYTTAGNISHCASDFWIFNYKIHTYRTFKDIWQIFVEVK